MLTIKEIQTTKTAPRLWEQSSKNWSIIANRVAEDNIKPTVETGNLHKVQDERGEKNE